MRKPRSLFSRATVLLVGLIALVANLGLGGIGVTSAGAAKATGSPLVFGQIGTDTGPDGIPQEGQAFADFVANWNAHGGYKGHIIKFIHVDDGLNTSVTASAARTLVTSDHVIGLVNYAFLDCIVNAQFYVANNVALFPAPCGPNPLTTAPVAGQSGGLTDIIKFAANTGVKKIAIQYPSVFTMDIPLLQQYVKTIGITLVAPPATPNAPTAADLDTFIAQARSAGATAVLSLTQGTVGVLLLQEAARQNFGPTNGIKYLFGPTEYTPTVINSINGSYVYTFGYPWNTKNAQVAAALKILKGHVSVLDGFAQSGYMMAGEFQQVLNLVKGPVTTASFRQAMSRATNITVPLTPGLHLSLTTRGKGQPVAGFMVQARNGSFVQVGGFIETRY